MVEEEGVEGSQARVVVLLGSPGPCPSRPS